MQFRGVGRSGRIPNSSTTTSSTRAATLRPGNSRNSFQKRFARASDHCARAKQSARWSPASPARNPRCAEALKQTQGRGDGTRHVLAPPNYDVPKYVDEAVSVLAPARDHGKKQLSSGGRREADLTLRARASTRYS